MAFGAAIEALIGADVSDVQAKGQLVETIALKMDAALQKVGLGNLADKSARESAQAMQQIMAAEERLAAFRRGAALEQMSVGERVFVLNRELVIQKQQLGTLEKGSLAYSEAELAIEEKQLEIQRLITQEQAKQNAEARAATRGAGSSTAGGGEAAQRGEVEKVLQRKFGLGDALKGLLQGVGIAGVTEIAEALKAPFKESAESAQRIAEYTEASLNSTRQLISLRQTDAQQLKALADEIGRIRREGEKAAEPSKWREVAAVMFKAFGRLDDAQRILLDAQANAEKKAKANADAAEKEYELAQRRLALEEKKASIAEYYRKLALEDLSAKERVAALDKDINGLLQQVVVHQNDALKVEKIREQIRGREAEQRQAIKELHQQTNLSEEKQLEQARLTLEYRKTGSSVAKAQLDILQLQTQQLEKHSELLPLIQKGYQNLTPVERARFEELVKQGDKLEKQIQQKAEIIAATKQQADAEKLVGGVIDSNIDKWEQFVGVIRSTGRSDRDLTDRELAKKIQNIQDDIAQRQIADMMRGGAGPIGADFFIAPQKFNLQQALAEQNFRNSVRSAASQFGADRAFGMFPGLTEQRFQDILNGTTEQQRTSRETLDQVKKLNENFANGFTKLSESIKSSGGLG